jgi:hypothetical protein
LGNISAEALTVEQLFRLGTFEPSRVQRDYQWTSKECAQLLQDLERALQQAGADPDPASPLAGLADGDVDPVSAATDDYENKADAEPIRTPPRKTTRRAPPQSYYLGPMVLLRRPQAKGAYYIYDGQQRFTTISIMIAAVRDLLKTTDWLPIQEMLRTADDAKRARLQVPTPGGSLARITGALGGCTWPGKSAARSPADVCMYRAATLFTDEMRPWSPAKLHAFVDYLRTCTFVTATYVDDPALAHLVFETANTRGKPLLPGDILKGHLVRVVYEDRGSGAADEVAQHWERTRRALGPRFHAYLRAVDFVAHGKPRGAELGDDFLEEFDGPDRADAATAFVATRLPGYLSDYQPTFEHEQQTKDRLTGLQLAFRRLSFLRWREWEAVAMAFHHRHKDEPSRFENAIKKLQRVCYCFHLLGWHNRPNSRAHALSKAIDQIDNGLNPFKRWAAQGQPGALSVFYEQRDQVRGALRAPLTDERDIYGPVVRWIESLDWPQGVPHRLYQDTSVEHVLPRSHGAEWRDAIPDETERERCKNLIGNLCLLPNALNESLANQGPAAKLKAFLDTDASLFRGAHDIASRAVWDAVAIEERTERLARLAEVHLDIVAAPKAASAANPPAP